MSAPDRTVSLLFLLLTAVQGAARGARAEKPPKPAAPQPPVPADERLKIEAALPATAAVTPARPRKLLIFDRNVGYPGHRSIAHAALAFTLMGEKTGAFEAITSRDPQVFSPGSLRRFDAVFFNNTVGNCFQDPRLRESLIDFVYGGGGLLGVHGTTVAFTRWPGAHEDWPEFGIMLGGRGARHRESDELVTVTVECPGHPITQPFGAPRFEYRDEFFRVNGPYSRDRVRVLLSIDIERTDLRPRKPWYTQERTDNDYALAWVRNYGRGRVFYSTIAHNPRVFWDPPMLRFYLAAVQFALGDLPAPTTPSSKLAPAVRAQESLGWRLGAAADSFRKETFFEAIERTAALGLSYIGGSSAQTVSAQIPVPFGPGLTAGQRRQIRLKLDGAGVRLLTYEVHTAPDDGAGWRNLLAFARIMGIETVRAGPPAAALDMIEPLCDHYEVNLALHPGDAKPSPAYGNPADLVKLCTGRGSRIGACGDLGTWLRSGMDPIEAAKTLAGRLITLEVHDRSADGRDVPWGTGVGRTERFFNEIRRLSLRPTMVGLPCPRGANAEAVRSIDFFNAITVKVAQDL